MRPMHTADDTIGYYGKVRAPVPGYGNMGVRWSDVMQTKPHDQLPQLSGSMTCAPTPAHQSSTSGHALKMYM
jgi:hypothetical protein